MATHDCAICMDIYKAPRMIPCGHSFCTQCLELLIEQCPTNWCPLCKQAFFIASVNQLPRNYALEDSLALAHKLSTSSSSNSADASCGKRCTAHAMRSGDLFCTECKQQVCHECATSDAHAGHTLSAVYDALIRESTRTRELLARARRDEAALLALDRNKSQQTRQMIETDGEGEIRRVNERFDRLVTDLRAIQDRLTRNVRVTVQTVMRQLDREDSRLLSRSRSIIQYLDELLRTDNVVEMAARAERVSFELERIEAATDRKRCLVPRSLLDDELGAYIDQVHIRLDLLRQQAESREYYHLNTEKEHGTIMCLGGCRSGGRVATEVYDSITNKWMVVSSTLTKSSERATAFANSKAIVSGGRNGQTVMSEVEYFDIETNSWTEAVQMTSARCGHSMVALDGYVYAVGGHDGVHYLTSVERCECDSPNNEWILSEPLLLARDQPACTAIRNKLLAAGGFDGNTTHSSCEAFDPEINRWSFVASMNVERSSAAIATWNGCAYIFGGSNSEFMHMDTIEQYDPVCDQWTLFETRMVEGREGHGVASFSDQVFIVGGWGKAGELSSVERFSPIEKICARDTCSLVTARGNVAITFCDVPIEALLRGIGLDTSSAGRHSPNPTQSAD